MKEKDFINQLKLLIGFKKRKHELVSIKDIDFDVRDQYNLTIALKSLFNLCSIELDSNLKNKLKSDFEKFSDQGRWIIHNTFNGGVFLREPERILFIKLEFSSVNNIAKAIVEFESEIRNKRNTKYKPNTGKTEVFEWKIHSIFPHFNLFPKIVQGYLISTLAKIGKEICENSNKNSWHLIYTHDFEISAILENEVIEKFKVFYLRDEKSPLRLD
jgi:hypothetical protein